MRGARGFGLIEVLISASILFIGVVAVVHTVNVMEAIYTHQRFVTGAMHVAEGTLEELLGRYPNDVEIAGGASITGPEYSPEGKVMPAGTGFYKSRWDVVADTPVLGVRTMTVTVAWVEDAGPRSFQLKAVRL
jgi:hypothetical protein